MMYADKCRLQSSFLCQVEYFPLKRAKTATLNFKKDELTFSSFLVWYRYKAVGQRLLDSLKDKRMTGLRFRWKIEDPSMIWTSNVREVGRSIKTPRLGEFVKKNGRSKDVFYKATLTIPEYFEERVGNNTLVVEITMDIKTQSELSWTTNYKLVQIAKKWTDAKAYCRSEGGQLASIHSEEQQVLAVEASQGKFAFLGGRKEEGQEWGWSDNSSWDFSNWRSSNGNNDEDLCLGIFPNGEWGDWYFHCNSNYRFLCQADILVEKATGLTRLEVKKKSLQFFPLNITLRIPAQNEPLTNASKKRQTLPAFKLNWFLEDRNGNKVTEILPANEEHWKRKVQTPNYEQYLSLAKIVQLARQFRLQRNMSERGMIEKVIYEKVKHVGLLDGKDMCSMEQVKHQNQTDFIGKVVPKILKVEGLLSKEDIRNGFELFHAVVFCPETSIKVSRFVDQLLLDESQKTLINALVNLLRSDILKDTTIMASTKQFYFEVASILYLQYGNILVAMSNNSQRQALMRYDWPFFSNTSQLVEKCLEDSSCDGFQSMLQNMGNSIYVCKVHLICLLL